MFAALALIHLLNGQGRAETVSFLTAIQKGKVSTVEQMLKRNPKLLYCRSKSGSSPLQWAVYTSQATVLKDLLSHRPKMDMGDACAVGDLDAVAELANRDPSTVKALTVDGFTPLCLATACLHPEVVALLVNRGADINGHSRSIEHVAPINSAAFIRDPSMMELLFRYHADPNTAEDGGWTALDEAATNGDDAIVAILLKHGADPKLKDGTGKTAYDYAIKAKHSKTASLLRVQ